MKCVINYELSVFFCNEMCLFCRFWDEKKQTNKGFIMKWLSIIANFYHWKGSEKVD